MEPDRFITFSLRDNRLTRILAASLDAVEPGRIVRQYLVNNDLPAHRRLFLLGIGKAAEPMTVAAADFFDTFEKALIITKRSLGKVEAITSSQVRGVITLMEAGHPIPDERSLAAGQAVMDFVSSLEADDLLLCMISGGGSALVTAPLAGLSLSDLQIFTAVMLTRGAAIDEFNLLRRQVDRLKGGGLLKAAKSKILCLILSDVIDDDLTTIASGLTVPDHSKKENVLAILNKYKIKDRISEVILNDISLEKEPDPSIIDRVKNVIVANNKIAARGAYDQAIMDGFFAEMVKTNLMGQAGMVGKELAGVLKAELASKPLPFCLIFGGETTVTVRGTGKGGRNQELALAAVDTLADLQNGMLVSLATDGNDGPTDAAGAVVTGETRRRSLQLGMEPGEYLMNNDSYTFFDSLGDLLKPGYTGTNVNDLIFLFGF